MFKRKLPEPNITDVKAGSYRSYEDQLEKYMERYDKKKINVTTPQYRVERRNGIITPLPVPPIPEWVKDVTWAPKKPSDDNPICHDNCHYTEHVVHPVTAVMYGKCECGQYWMGRGTSRKAIIRLKYVAVSEEIEAAEEVVRIETAKRAENILGPDVADNLFPKLAVVSGNKIVPVADWEISPISRQIPSIPMQTPWPGTAHILGWPAVSAKYYMPWDKDYVAGFRLIEGCDSLDDCLKVMDYKHIWFPNDQNACYVMSWVSPWEYSVAQALGGQPSRYYAKFDAKQATELWSHEGSL